MGNTDLKIGIITQARMTSTRLPGKVLMQAGGKSLLQHQFERLRSVNVPIFLATTELATDDPIVDFAKENDISVFRGSENDVLSRFMGVITEQQLDVVIRVTSDCPLIDGHLIADGLSQFLKLNDPNVYYSNCLERTYPRGFDFEVMFASALKIADQSAKEPYFREHVTSYLYRAQTQFKLIHHKRSSSAAQFRVTVDEPKDFELVKQLIEKYDAHKLSVEQIIHILEENPQLAGINSSVEQKKI